MLNGFIVFLFKVAVLLVLFVITDTVVTVNKFIACLAHMTVARIVKASAVTLPKIRSGL